MIKALITFFLAYFALATVDAQGADEPTDRERRFAYAIQAGGGALRGDLGDYVSEVGLKIAAQARLDLEFEFVVVNESAPRVWVLPGGKTGISRGMLLLLRSEAELAALLAHEIAHLALHKPQYSSRTDPGHDCEREALVGEAADLDKLMSPVYGDGDEASADIGAQNYMARAGYDPAAQVSLQQRHLQLSGDAGWRRYFAIHEPSARRLDGSRETVRRLQTTLQETNWFNGEAEFRAGTAQLREVAPVWTLHDEARCETDPGNALALIDAALNLAPEERPFLTLKAVILKQLGEKGPAMKLLDAIIADGPGYRALLERGLLRLDLLGDKGSDLALTDLRDSYQLLPTARAAVQLAPMEEQRGNLQAAKGLYVALMAGGGDYQANAGGAFVKLDMRDNPALYFMAQSLIRDEQFMTIITNQSGHPVAGVEVVFSAVINGRQRQETAMTGALDANSQVRVYPGWVIGADDEFEQVRVHVARIVEADEGGE